MSEIDENTEHLFFLRRLEEALAQEGLRISDDARAYLMYVLADHAVDLSRPLAPDFAEALEEQSSTHREQLLRRVGNSALLMCGLWWHFVEYSRAYGHGMDASYYERLGTAAYQRIERALFRELADNFVGLVHAFARLGSSMNLDDNQEVLRLYEYALRTQNTIAKKLLLARGIVLENESSLEQ